MRFLAFGKGPKAGCQCVVFLTPLELSLSLVSFLFLSTNDRQRRRERPASRAGRKTTFTPRVRRREGYHKPSLRPINNEKESYERPCDSTFILESHACLSSNQLSFSKIVDCGFVGRLWLQARARGRPPNNPTNANRMFSFLSFTPLVVN